MSPFNYIVTDTLSLPSYSPNISIRLDSLSAKSFNFFYHFTTSLEIIPVHGWVVKKGYRKGFRDKSEIRRKNLLMKVI